MPLMHDLVHEPRNRIRLEGRGARQQVIHGDPQGVQVRLARDLARRKLFGRHVGRCAKNDSGSGPARVRQPRNAEIRQLQPVRCRVVHQVRRLDVPVHDILGVRIVQGLRRPCHELEDHLWRQQPAELRVVAQGLALEILHGEVGDVIVLAGIMNGDDVRMIEAAGRFRLPEEVRAGRGQVILGKLLGERQGLDCHPAIDRGSRPR